MKLLKSIAKGLGVTFGIVSSSMMLSSAAKATFYWDVSADAGSFAPIVLGEDIALDGCGSRLFVVGYTPYGTSMCDMMNLSLFGANWFAKNEDTNAFSWLTGNLGTDPNIDVLNIPVNTAAANLQTTVSTGAGSFFSSPGTYSIGLYVAGTTNHVSFTEIISNGGTPFHFNASLGPDYATTLTEAISQNGNLNNAAAWGSSFTISGPVAVPEPSQLLLLVPGLIWVARRQRQKARISA
ncbi:MAG: PEP-CTERM sorting domain-containing protein [Kordiimonadaceae bacterium]|nr:PEP-CTERM sorting domain-containing protein [Kordiimonadaceae bacterium]MBO6569974.1 PEP-CTERM sorting domain-containing protein [Kordiimonadaceae bacterium]MBO6965929.1 PEP-CTERM sorting domain-containing protein [Kordiimonadaceae bacterium]